MFDVDAITKRAQAAGKQASERLKEMKEQSDRLRAGLEAALGSEAGDAAAQEEAQRAASETRQVELLGQVLDADGMAQLAANQAQLEQMLREQLAQATAMGAEGAMSQIFGEDMGVIAAALETLAIEEDGEDEQEEPFDLAREEGLYTLLEDTMTRLEGLPEPEPDSYGRDKARWERFGILLSGIVSTLNDHKLDGMEVEERIPVMEQQVLSIVRRSWGIGGRGELLDMLRYLTQEGYILRYQRYAEAASPEEILVGEEDEEERENIARTWRFVQRYRDRYAPGFLAGWDVGRAAMLTRWGCFVGWLTESEAVGILWDLSQRASEELHSWREFAQSYLFGGMMWKLLCGDSAAASYLGYVADAATRLIAGGADRGGGQWRDFPWPAQRKIGFAP